MPDTFTTQEGAVFAMSGASCPRCSAPSALAHRSGAQGFFSCPDCSLVYDEPDFTEASYVTTIEDEPCDCSAVIGPGGRFLLHAPGGHPDCEAQA